jgi:hypothetical protein
MHADVRRTLRFCIPKPTPTTGYGPSPRTSDRLIRSSVLVHLIDDHPRCSTVQELMGSHASRTLCQAILPYSPSLLQSPLHPPTYLYTSPSTFRTLHLHVQDNAQSQPPGPSLAARSCEGRSTFCTPPPWSSRPLLTANLQASVENSMQHPAHFPMHLQLPDVAQPPGGTPNFIPIPRPGQTQSLRLQEAETCASFPSCSLHHPHSC